MNFTFTGNQVRALLREGKPEYLAGGLPNIDEVRKIKQLMILLGKIQSFAEARMLNDEEINELEKAIAQYKEV